MPERNLFRTMQEKRRSILVAITALILLAFDGCLLLTGTAVTPLDGLVLDGLFQLRGSREPHPQIAIIGISESSLGYADTEAARAAISTNELDLMEVSWPWDRRVFASLIERLAEGGARQIVLDFVLKSRLGGDPELERVLRTYGDRVVLACVLRHGNSAVPVYFGPRDRFVESAGLSKSDIVAFTNLAKEHETVRRAYLTETVTLPDGQETKLLSLSALAARRVRPDIAFPVSDRGDLVNFAGPGGTYEMLPIEAFFSDPDASASFGNKIVIVGPYADVQFKDRHLTPVGIMPGPEIHANQLASLLEQSFVRELPLWAHFLISMLFATLVLIVCFRSGSVVGKVLQLAGLATTAMVAAAATFLLHGPFIPVSGVLASVMICGGLALVYEFTLEQHQRWRIHSMFGTYVSRHVVDRMVASGEEPRLGGSECEITSFFSDIQDFTSLVEPMTPTQTVELMNQYLSAMTDEMEAQGGTLDKYVGDSIVGLFGAPIPLADHAARACLAALAMQKAQAQLRETWSRDRESWSRRCMNMRTRIGINSGLATVGNMGSSKRFNYTSMGDTVNMASRCESASGRYGVYILVTDQTRTLALRDRADLVFRPIDRILVKGRTIPEGVCELMGIESELSDRDLDCLTVWSEAMSLCHQRQWRTALERFEACRPLEPNLPERAPGVRTTPSDIMIKRCRGYMAQPPGPDWNGVYVMTSKT